MRFKIKYDSVSDDNAGQEQNIETIGDLFLLTKTKGELLIDFLFKSIQSWSGDWD